MILFHPFLHLCLASVIVQDDNEQLKCVASLTIANCAQLARNRRMVRRHGGIEKLVNLLATKSAPTGKKMAFDRKQVDSSSFPCAMDIVLFQRGSVFFIAFICCHLLVTILHTCFT